MTSLKAGTQVYVLGTFKDFVQVELSNADSSLTGFVAQTTIGSTSEDVAELDVRRFTWLPMDLATYFFDASISLRGQDLVLNNAGYNGYYDYQGPPFALDSGLRITVKIQTSDHQFGSLKFQDRPNVQSGDWWKGIRRLDLATDGFRLYLDVHDGTEEAGTVISLRIPDAQAVTLTFPDPYGKFFTVSDQQGRQIQRVDVTSLSSSLSQGLFPEKKVYIGCVASPHSQLTISSLSAEKAPSGEWSASSPQGPTGLRRLSKQRGITMGTELSWWSLRNPAYRNIMVKDFDVAILSDFSSQEFWRGRGQYNYEYLDNIVDWTLHSGWRVRASHLVWGAVESKAIPEWLLKGQYSRDEYIQILQKHVKTVVGHYKGRVTEWSIANEAISRSFCDSGCDFWNDKIGPEYIEIAFRAAKEADPDSILIFNDFNNESARDAETRRVIDKMLITVRDLRAREVPIDVVGMQMHLLLPWSSQTPPTKEDVLKTMQQFGALGVDVYVTELDMNLHGRQGSQQERWEFEAALYHDMMAACLESGVCKSFATWGLSDANSWLTCTDGWWCVKLEDADPLMFDKEYRPKPAYNAVYDALADEQ